jgi:hypothetical protein
MSDIIKNNENIEIDESYNLHDNFWALDYKVLFDKNNISNFFPTNEMTTIEKLNAVMRLGIYLSITLYLTTANYHYFYIMILIGVFTYFIYTTQQDNIELYFNSDGDNTQNLIQKSIISKDTSVEPTVENPFMNINLITDNKTKKEAPPSWNDEESQKKIEDKFDYNLYRDVGDLYGKSNSQREYYTMPSTTIPNNQTSFAKWCYGVGPTCKEKSIYCAPEMSPVPFIDTSNTTPYTDAKY